MYKIQKVFAITHKGGEIIDKKIDSKLQIYEVN
jgi:hypothetical protein